MCPFSPAVQRLSVPKAMVKINYSLMVDRYGEKDKFV
jgi:hypothetical protein